MKRTIEFISLRNEVDTRALLEDYMDAKAWSIKLITDNLPCRIDLDLTDQHFEILTKTLYMYGDNFNVLAHET